ARRRREAEADRLPAARGFDALDLLESLHARLNLARLGRLVAEALDEPLDARDLPRLLGGLLLERRLPRLARLEVVVVAAGELGELPAIELDDAAHHPVQEVPVVRDDDERPLPPREEALEPVHRLEVEV